MITGIIYQVKAMKTMKIEKISLEVFNEMLKLSMNEENSLRVGQSFFSNLYARYPTIAEEITGTKYDPFYVDENLYDLFELIVDKTKK